LIQASNGKSGCVYVISAVVLALWLRCLTERRIRTYPAITAFVLVAAGLIQTVASRRPWWTVWGADFRAFYGAGLFVRTGRADLLYDIPAQLAFQEQALGGAGEVSIWLSPPFVAWFFVPLSLLSFPIALVVQVMTSLAAAAVALFLLRRELGRPSTREMAWAAVAYYPTLQSLSEGQLSAVSLLVFTEFFVLLRRGHDARAGVVLGCLAYKPQLAVGLAAALVGARRFRALASALAVALLFYAFCWATLPGPTRDYIRRAPELDAVLRGGGYPSAGLHSLFQVSTLLFDAFSHRAATVLGVALTAAALVALVALWRREPWKASSANWDRRMAATLALAVVASPHLFGYDLMLLLLPFFIVWHLYPSGTDGRPLDGGPVLAMTALVWALALLGPALTVGQQAVTRWAFARSFALQLGVVAIVAWAWVTARPRNLVEPKTTE